MCTGFPNLRPRSGFSLTEVLIAVAIIGILTALLFGGLGSLRKQGLTTRCIANLRQVGTAVNAYAGEHNGLYPPTAANGRSTPQGWKQTPWAEQLVEADYSGSGAIFLCPAIAPTLTQGENLSGDTPGTSYSKGHHTYGLRSMHPAKTTTWTGDYYDAPIHRIRIPNPSRSIVIVDSIGLFGEKVGAYHITPYLSWAGVHFRHGSHANALFADGHVESMTEGEMAACLRAEGSPEHAYNEETGGWFMLW